MGRRSQHRACALCDLLLRAERDAHPAAPSGTAATLRQLRHDECTLHHNCDIGSLEEIVPGRTYLTLAPGFISTRSMGMGRAPVAFMRDAILDLRRLLAGEAVEFG
jgi:hypothetical protein